MAVRSRINLSCAEQPPHGRSLAAVKGAVVKTSVHAMVAVGIKEQDLTSNLRVWMDTMKPSQSDHQSLMVDVWGFHL